MDNNYRLPVKVYENGTDAVYVQTDSNGVDYARYLVQYNTSISRIELLGGGVKTTRPVLVLPQLDCENSSIPHIDAGAIRGCGCFTIINPNDELTINSRAVSNKAVVQLFTKNKNDKLLVEEISIPGSIDDYEYFACYYVGSNKQPGTSTTHNDGVIETISTEIKDNNSNNLPRLFNLNENLTIKLDNSMVAKNSSDGRVLLVEAQEQESE